MKKVLSLLTALLGILVLTPGLWAQEDKDWAKFGRYAQANAAQENRPLAVLMGDSITDGWAKQDGEWLKAQDFLGRGISGQTTSQMLVRFRADVLELKPSYVVILAGINDIARNNGFISTAHILDNIVSMCELAVLHGIQPVLCSVLPASAIGWRKDLGNPTELILELNALLASYATSQGFPYVDYYTPMADKDGSLLPAYARDPVHPNLDGYHKMEEILLGSVDFKYQLKVMSYNIRYATAKDGPYSWPLRREAAAAMVLDQQPAVFGVQEALQAQLEYLEEACPAYRSIGVGREDGVHGGEHMSIFYDTTCLDLVQWGTYWLSETPDVPSKGWDAACKRTATWALLKDRRNGKEFFFVNTHLDHVGEEARRKGLELVVKRIGSMNPGNSPMILCGDFNVYPDDPCLKDLRACMLDARETATATDGAITYHGWGKARKDGPIDYIFWNGFSGCTSFSRVTQPYLGCPYVSDHYPVTAVFTL